MSQTNSAPGTASGQALLCWSETPNSAIREEFVQVLESHSSEAIIKSTVKVSEQTKITLIGKDYTGIGIVRSCRKETTDFILDITMGNEANPASLSSLIDPGALFVDDFLSEEQERNILEALQDPTR
jgi:hypothetical protein